VLEGAASGESSADLSTLAGTPTSRSAANGPVMPSMHTDHMAGTFLPPAVHRKGRVESFLRLVGAFTAVAVIAASCGDDDDEAETATESPAGDRSYEADVDEADVDTESPAGGGSYEADVDTGCFTNYPTRLEVTTRYPDEVQYLDDITVCTTPAEDVTLIANNSDTAWTITTTGGSANVKQLTHTLRLGAFRELAQTVYRYPLLAPHSRVEVAAEPYRVEWLLAPNLSAMWLYHNRLADTVESYFQGWGVNLLSRRTPWGGAIATCAVAAYNQTGPAGELLSSNDTGKKLFAAVGMFNAGTKCGKALQQADDPAARALQQADDPAARASRNRATALTDEAARFFDAVDFIRYADDHLSLWKSVGQRLAARATALFP
jgi:hypothetical protein